MIMPVYVLDNNIVIHIYRKYICRKYIYTVLMHGYVYSINTWSCIYSISISTWSCIYTILIHGSYMTNCT